MNDEMFLSLVVVRLIDGDEIISHCSNENDYLLLFACFIVIPQFGSPLPVDIKRSCSSSCFYLVHVIVSFRDR